MGRLETVWRTMAATAQLGRYDAYAAILLELARMGSSDIVAKVCPPLPRCTADRGLPAVHASALAFRSWPAQARLAWTWHKCRGSIPAAFRAEGYVNLRVR